MVRFRPEVVERLMVHRIEAVGSAAPLPLKDTSPRRKGDKTAVAAIYSVSRRTVENWVRVRLIPWQRLATGRVRFDLAEVERVLARFIISGGTPMKVSRHRYLYKGIEKTRWIVRWRKAGETTGRGVRAGKVFATKQEAELWVRQQRGLSEALTMQERAEWEEIPAAERRVILACRKRLAEMGGVLPG
jgi:hypothetical protein